MAILEPPPPEVQDLLAALHGNPEGTDAFVSVIAGTMSAVEFLGPDIIGRLLNARLPA